MNFNYSQIFLLVCIIAFWVYYLLTYGKIEAKHEKSIGAKYGRTRLGKILGPFIGLITVLWTIFVLIYFFNYDSVNWIWKISLLDNDFVKIVAMVIISFGFLFEILFSPSVGKSIKVGVSSGEKPKLVTTGIYRYIRNSSYLGLGLIIFGTFLIIPNMLILVFLLFSIVVLYTHTLEEEKILIKIYGKEYEDYKKKVGRFLPKIIKKE